MPSHLPQRAKKRIRLTLGRMLVAVLIAAPGAVLGMEESDSASNHSVALFAGGCFWCMEPPYDKLDGVIETTAGYTGGPVEDPSYEQVVTGETGHAEAVRVVYDPDRVSYARLLVTFWHNIDPLAEDRQFCDRGSQYRSAIFPRSPHQRRLAERSRELLASSGRFQRPIATEITEAGPFYRAEEKHQDYYREHAYRYKLYRWSCGRDDRLEELWGELAGIPEPGPALQGLVNGG